MSQIGSGTAEGVTQGKKAGERVPITEEQLTFATKTVVVQALGTNEGEIVVGGKSVVAAPGTHAAPTQVGVALAAKGTISVDIDDPRKIYFDVIKEKDGVSWVALTA